MDKLPLIDSLSPFIHHKKPHKICFVGLKCQTCRDLRAFLGVKSGLVILVRVKDLTFSNSVTKSVTMSAMNRLTSRKLIVVITDAQGMILLRGRDCTPKHFHPDWEVEANQPWWSWRQPGKLNLCQFDRKKHIAHATG